MRICEVAAGHPDAPRKTVHFLDEKSNIARSSI